MPVQQREEDEGRTEEVGAIHVEHPARGGELPLPDLSFSLWFTYTKGFLLSVGLESLAAELLIEFEIRFAYIETSFERFSQLVNLKKGTGWTRI